MPVLHTRPMKKCLVLILAVLALLTTSIAGAFALEVVATPRFKPRVSVTAFEQRYPRTLAVLKADFPEDYKNLLDRIGSIEGARGSKKDKITAAFAALSEVRKRYEPQVLFAPDDELRRIVALLGEFHLQVLKNQGPEVCGQFAANGSGTLFTLGLADPYAGRLDVQSEAYFLAVVQSIENPTFHKVATTDDWKYVSRALVVAAGGTTDDVKRALTNDTKDPLYCASLAKFMLFTALIGGDEGERLRANFVQNSTGY